MLDGGLPDMAEDVEPVQLKPETLQAFFAYLGDAEQGMQNSLEGDAFLWAKRDPKRTKQIRSEKIVAELWPGKNPIKVPSGLIHDWIGSAFLPAASLAATLERIQDYDNHKKIYTPEVIDSRLIRREGDDFQIYLRVLKKKIVTVVLDTYHDVHYYRLTATRSGCRSITTQVAEVDDAGKPGERILPPDAGYGFLWRLASYWRFEEQDGGVYAECRAISLTRDIPTGLRWVIAPIIRSLPKEALIQTLKSTRASICR